MRTHLSFEIQPQPDNTTCGPTCLQAIYRHYGDTIGLGDVVREVHMLETGGTLAVQLANHALARGYRATIYTYNLQVFDPTWFSADGSARADLATKLSAQSEAKHNAKLRTASKAYLDFLAEGGELRYQELTTDLIRHYLKRGVPMVTGLSATYLYRSPREFGANCDYDDIRGEPAGHFVVLCGYDKETREVRVADPLHPNPLATTHQYEVPIVRVISSILLGILTYDANVLVIEPGKKSHYADAAHRR